MLYALFFTIFIKNSALRKNKVQRDILELQFSEVDSAGYLQTSYTGHMNSPRIRKDGSIFYLSQEGISLVYANNYENWRSEINYLESFGLKRVYDFMPVVSNVLEDAEYPELLDVEQQELQECKWLKLIPLNYVLKEKMARSGRRLTALCKEFIVNQQELARDEVELMGFVK